MWRDDLDPKGRLVDFDDADSVDKAHRLDGPALFDLIKYFVKLVLGHFLECFIVDRGNGALPFRLPHDPGKINGSAHAVRHLPLCNERGLVNGRSGNEQRAFHVSLPAPAGKATRDRLLSIYNRVSGTPGRRR